MKSKLPHKASGPHPFPHLYAHELCSHRPWVPASLMSHHTPAHLPRWCFLIAMPISVFATWKTPPRPRFNVLSLLNPCQVHPCLLHHHAATHLVHLLSQPSSRDVVNFLLVEDSVLIHCLPMPQQCSGQHRCKGRICLQKHRAHIIMSGDKAT